MGLQGIFSFCFSYFFILSYYWMVLNKHNLFLQTGPEMGKIPISATGTTAPSSLGLHPTPSLAIRDAGCCHGHFSLILAHP